MTLILGGRRIACILTIHVGFDVCCLARLDFPIFSIHTSYEGETECLIHSRYSDLLRLSQQLTTFSIGHEVKSRSALFRSSCLALYSASQHSYKRFRCSSHFSGEYVLRLRQPWRSQAGSKCQGCVEGMHFPPVLVPWIWQFSLCVLKWMCSVLHSLTKQDTQTGGGGGIQYDDKSRRA